MQLFSERPVQGAPVNIPDDVPVYRVGEGKFAADDELFMPGTIIAWEYAPAPDFTPLNALAMKKMREYLMYLDECGRKKAEKDGYAYVSMLEQFETNMAPPEDDGRKARVLNSGAPQKSILGKKRGRPRVSKISTDANSEVISTGVLDV